MEEIDESQIIDLIQQGFDTELISIEFGVPNEKLIAMQEELRQQKEKKTVRKKASNLAKSQSKNNKRERVPAEEDQVVIIEEPSDQSFPNYMNLIEKYQKAIEQDSRNYLNNRNLLAFTYFRAGMIEEARQELLDLIQTRGSYMAYRILVYLEKQVGNIDDAKYWAYEGIEAFPGKGVGIREQLVEIAREQGDMKEVKEQLEAILQIEPVNSKIRQQLNEVNAKER